MWSPCWFWESEIPENICDQIIDCSDNIEYKRGLIDNGTGKYFDSNVRNVDMKFLHENSFNWINALTCGYALYANCKNYQYKLSNCIDREGVQLSHYTVGQYYDKHVDFNGSPDSKGYTRKLSMSVQLSDEKSYEGGDLIVYYGGDKYIAPKSKGTVFIFDSKLTHEVTPVIKGERYSLVKWFHGDEPLK